MSIYSTENNKLSNKERRELEYNILAYKNIKDYDSDQAAKIYSYLVSFYTNVRNKCSQLIATNESESMKKNFGLGFNYILDEYVDDEVILDFFAKNTIEDIFDMEDSFLKRLVQNNNEFTTTILSEKVITKFILDYIIKIDCALFWYIYNHSAQREILKNVIYRIQNIICKCSFQMQNIIVEFLETETLVGEYTVDCILNHYWRKFNINVPSSDVKEDFKENIIYLQDYEKFLELEKKLIEVFNWHSNYTLKRAQ